MSGADDDALARRVAKLKDNTKSVTQTDDELADRFARVFSTRPVVAMQKSNVYNVPDDATILDDDEVEKLLMEAQLLDDDVYDGLDGTKPHDMCGMLDNVLGSSINDASVHPGDSDALLRQIQDQVAMESKYEKLTQQQEDALEERYRALKQGPQPAPSPLTQIPKPIDPSEFFDEMDDWCCICNEDATWICEGCDNDKFCDACFYEGHQSEMATYEASQHRAKKWTKSK